MDMAETRT
jgi:tripartite-type tricarboxylate transporter receptor subunit TctC